MLLSIDSKPETVCTLASLDTLFISNIQRADPGMYVCVCLDPTFIT